MPTVCDPCPGKSRAILTDPVRFAFESAWGVLCWSTFWSLIAYSDAKLSPFGAKERSARCLPAPASPELPIGNGNGGTLLDRGARKGVLRLGRDQPVQRKLPAARPAQLKQQARPVRRIRIHRVDQVQPWAAIQVRAVRYRPHCHLQLAGR